MENVNNEDHISRTTNTAVPIPTQSADALAPALPTHRRAAVEDADDEVDDTSARNATAQQPTNSASISDTTPQHCQYQEDQVDEGGPMEGKSNSHILIFF